MRARTLAEVQKAISRQHDEGSIARTQNIRLRRLLRHAYQNTDYYGDRFAAHGLTLGSILSRQNFFRLPFLTKHDVNVCLARLIPRNCSPLHLLKAHRGFTSGTTGVPVLVFLDQSSVEHTYAKLAQFLHSNDIVIEAGSTAILNVVEFESLNSYYYAIPSLGNSLGYRINISAEPWREPPRLLELINDLQPVIIQGRPTPLLMLADSIDSLRHNKRFQPRAIMSYGETLHRETRERLSTLLGAEVFDAYGITELGGIVGIECQQHNGFHIYSDRYVVEIVDGDGRPLGPGQVGEIVITSLVNRIMPIIRYRTEDIGSIAAGKCACGLAYPLLNLVEGRIVNFFIAADGSRFNPYPLGLLMEELPVLQYQIVQEDTKKVSITYVPKEEMDGQGWSQVVNDIKRRMGDDCEVEVRKVHHFARGEKTLQKFLCRVKSP